MENIACVILEDDPLASLLLEGLIKLQTNLTLLAVLDNTNDANRFFINNTGVDLLFLDVELNGESGIDFYKQLSYKPAVIFTTAYETFAFTAFELAALDYLKKPIDPHRFKEAIGKLKQKRVVGIIPGKGQQASEKQLMFKEGRTTIQVNSSDILFFEASKDYIKVVTLSKTYMVLLTMKALQQQLDNNMFLRINKSYIVNREHITKADNAQVYIQQLGFKISRTMKKVVMEKLYGRKH